MKKPKVSPRGKLDDSLWLPDAAIPHQTDWMALIMVLVSAAVGNQLHSAMFGSAFQGTVVPSNTYTGGASSSRAFRQGTEAKYEALNLEHYLRILERKLRIEDASRQRCCHDEECALDLCELMSDSLAVVSDSLQHELADPEGNMRSRQQAMKKSMAASAEYRQKQERYETIVSCCSEERTQHERLINVLDEHKRAVVRRMGEQAACDAKTERPAGKITIGMLFAEGLYQREVERGLLPKARRIPQSRMQAWARGKVWDTRDPTDCKEVERSARGVVFPSARQKVCIRRRGASAGRAVP